MRVENSTLLQTKVQLASGHLRATTDALWHHADLPRMFVAYLVLAHQIVRASVPLMEAARQEAEARQGGANGNRAKYLAYLAEHIAEERDHDEWTLQDLEASGIKRERVLKLRPPAAVAALVGAQYYWIFHHDPLALLGYMIVLEGFAVPEESVENLQRKTGLPDEIFRTYRHHSVADIAHSDDIYELLDDLDLDAGTNELIGLSALHTVRMLAVCLDELRPRPELLN